MAENPESPAARQSLSWRRSLGQAVLVVFTIEVGLVLLTLPWTPIWTNTIAVISGASSWRLALLSSWVRGIVSGLGLLNLWAAASEITHFH